jgi:hypothetical protein
MDKEHIDTQEYINSTLFRVKIFWESRKKEWGNLSLLKKSCTGLKII